MNSTKDETEMRREMRKKVSDAANGIYLKCPMPLKYLIGDLVEENKKYTSEKWDKSQKQKQILKQGFTDNQKEWILEILNEKTGYSPEGKFFVFDEIFGYESFKHQIDAKEGYNSRLHQYLTNYSDSEEELQSLVWGIEKSSGEWHRLEDQSGEIEYQYQPFPEVL